MTDLVEYLPASTHGRGGGGGGIQSLQQAIEHAALQEQAAGDDHSHDLVGAFQYLVYTCIAHPAFQWVIIQIAVSAMDLQRLVADIEAMVGGKAFGHGAVEACFAVAMVELV